MPPQTRLAGPACSPYHLAACVIQSPQHVFLGYIFRGVQYGSSSRVRTGVVQNGAGEESWNKPVPDVMQQRITLVYGWGHQ